MAKQDLGSGELFRKTEKPKGLQQWPEDNSDLDLGRIMPSGVGLRTGEIAALDQIALRHDVARNGLIRFAVRKFILDYRAGEIDLGIITEPKPVTRRPLQRLKMPK